MVELKITADDRGQISLSGPVDNTLLCYGLLEVARDIVKDRQDQTAKRVVPASGEELRNLKLHP